MLNRKAIYLALALALAFNVTDVAADGAASKPSVKAQPETQPVVKQSSAAEQIAQTNERVAVLSAKLSELETQAKIIAKQNEINKSNQTTVPTNIDDSFVPSIYEIGGADKKLSAILNMEGGNTQTVRVGDKVGHWKVRDIQVDFVDLERGKDVVRLTFGAYTPAINSGIPTASYNNLPPAPR